MTWTPPESWAPDEVVTAAKMNAQVKDNLLHLFDTKGRILQVVSTTTTTAVTTSSNSYTDTGSTATITPSATSSLVLVIANIALYQTTNGFGLRLLRGSTTILDSVADGTGPYQFYAEGDRSTLVFLDAPNAATATTYKTQGRRYSSGTLFFQPDDVINGRSTLTLLEVAG